MLGRTASSLYWMSRYMERAENLARLLEVGYRISLTPGFDGSYRNEWSSTLTAAACLAQYRARHEEFETETVARFILFDLDNPSSIQSCLSAARNNARAVRTAVARDVWEALNSAYTEFTAIGRKKLSISDLPETLQWVRNQALLFRGAMLGTLLRTEGYDFCQLGSFIERADQTARILDVKYYILLPRNEIVGGDLDSYQWETILRSVSAHRSYRHIYHDSYRPWNVAEFLILRPEMPRSLRFCYGWIDTALSNLCLQYHNESPSMAIAQTTHDQLRTFTMEKIFNTGLHEFLSKFIAHNNELSHQVGADYRFS